MSIYQELNPVPEHRTQFTFKCQREHIANVNKYNMVYSKKHTDVEIPLGSRDHVIVLETVTITFNLNIEPKDKARRIVNNVGIPLVSEKQREENMIHGIQSVSEWFNGLVWCKKVTLCGNNSYNSRKYNQKSFGNKIAAIYNLLTFL